MRRWTDNVLPAAALALVLAAVGWAQGGEANLDNDAGAGDLEAYSADPALAPGQFVAEDEDGDGDFDRLTVGTRGGGEIFGWADFDGRPEQELLVSDPTLPAGEIRQADPDGDGDADVIWVGTRGRDFNGDGGLETEEQGFIAGVGDLDGDGDLEIVAADSSRALGEFAIGAFGLDRSREDPFEVLWVGLANEAGSARAAAVQAIANVDGDGDVEVTLKDVRVPTSSEPRFGQFIDVDEDGDPDLIVE